MEIYAQRDNFLYFRSLLYDCLGGDSGLKHNKASGQDFKILDLYVVFYLNKNTSFRGKESILILSRKGGKTHNLNSDIAPHSPVNIKVCEPKFPVMQCFDLPPTLT
jgi:hypothetical protein